jgi:hypothetical protein
MSLALDLRVLPTPSLHFSDNLCCSFWYLTSFRKCVHCSRIARFLFSDVLKFGSPLPPHPNGHKRP